MSLIDDFMETCVLMDRVTTSDGEGGFTSAWVDGATIKLAITRDTSMNTRIAEAEGFTNTYTVTANNPYGLQFHDVIKREDGTYIRITNDKLDFPKMSSLKGTYQFSAEKWELTV